MRHLAPGRILRFHHLDASEIPKGNRPGIVEATRAGRYTVFYGSTFKRRREPYGSVVADPGPAARDVEPRPHSRSNVLDEVRGLGEQTERFDRAATGARPASPAKPREGFASMLGRLVQAGEQMMGTAVGAVKPNSCGQPVRWTGTEWVLVDQPATDHATVASEAYLGETTPRM